MNREWKCTLVMGRVFWEGKCCDSNNEWDYFKSLIFEFMESNNIGIWNSSVHFKWSIRIHEIRDLWIKGRKDYESSFTDGYGSVKEW